MYVWVVTDCPTRFSESLGGEEHGGFRMGRGCIDQNFKLRQVVEKVLQRKRKCVQLLWISKKKKKKYQANRKAF